MCDNDYCPMKPIGPRPNGWSPCSRAEPPINEELLKSMVDGYNKFMEEKKSEQKPKLISLEEWNEERLALTEPEYPHPNGIACPDCGGELNDTDSGILMSYPGQKRVLCPLCGFKGTRIE
jgi:hypothetical protein